MSNNNRSMPFRLTRRQLAAATGTAAVAGLASRFGMQSVAHAQMRGAVQTKRRFVFAYFPAGFDQLLFLDPRDPSVYTEEQRGMFLTDTRYEQLAASEFRSQVIRPRMAGGAESNLSFGPATLKYAANGDVKGPDLTRHADRIAIVRGINMGTVAHEVGYRFFNTGTFPAGNSARGSSVATQIAAMLGSTAPLPALSLRVEAYNETMPGRYSALRVNSIDDLLQVLAREGSMLEHDSVESALEQYATSERPCEVNVFDRRGLLTQMRESQGTAQTLLRARLSDRFNFLADSTNMPLMAERVALRQRYGEYLGRSLAAADINLPGSRAALAALAIKSGVAQCVSVMIGDGTDTHFSNNLDHANRLYPGIASLAALIDDLATSEITDPTVGLPMGDKWLDHTTIVAFSEFARTPLMNQFGGRDHHIASSCLVAGAGIRGNTVIGASGRVAMGVGLWDFQRNEVTDSTERGRAIMPPDVAATLVASTGFDPGDHRLDASIARATAIAPMLRTS
ncbi:MAG: DUF1501 domain-containing protein [Deltaproteobacteria bacterium]|nr:DUF1501 domain-containing protein [Deltaproteobacteria bacterium]